MLVLENGSSRRGGRGEAARALLARIRPPPITDEAIEARVRRNLARTATFPQAITVSIEHGCVDLRGPVETHERARIVKAVAAIRGVDSVLDLMTEPSPSFASGPALARTPPPRAVLIPCPPCTLLRSVQDGTAPMAAAMSPRR